MSRHPTLAILAAAVLLSSCALYGPLEDDAKPGRAEVRAAGGNPPVEMPAPSAAPSADSDNDGVPDTLDRCPRTQTGSLIDSNGCAVVVPRLPSATR